MPNDKYDKAPTNTVGARIAPGAVTVGAGDQSDPGPMDYDKDSECA